MLNYSSFVLQNRAVYDIMW